MGSEDSENRMSSLGVNEMIFQEYRPVDRVIREIEAIDQKSVNDYIKNFFVYSYKMYIKTKSGNKNMITKENFMATSPSSSNSFTLGPLGIIALVILALIILYVLYRYFFSQ
jgi:hypothetical protein